MADILNLPKFKKYTHNADNNLAYTRDKILADIPFDKHFEWYNKSYTAQIPKLDFKTNYLDGMLKRISAISTMKYLVMPNTSNGHVIVFNIYDINNRVEVNYATLFAESVKTLSDDIRKSLFKDQIIGDVALVYYSTSSSYISCDGEYRQVFNRYSDFMNTHTEIPDIMNDIIHYTTDIANKRRWTLHTRYFYGDDNFSYGELERTIKSNFIDQSMFAITWFLTLYNEYNNVTESHLNKLFKSIFLKHVKIDLEFIKELVKKYGTDAVETFKIRVSTMTHPILGSDQIRHVALGYKMIPLNLREIQDPLKIRYKPWREIFISNKCNDLIVNQIAPGFPIALDWFLIKKTTKGLFDNVSQYNRLKHSELARSILTMLYDARRNTHFATSTFDTEPITTEHVTQWISSKFKTLSNKIKEPINYAIEEIIMSDVALTYPSEFVGRTFADIIQLISKSKVYDEKIGRPFHNYEMFSKYMFEICYGLLCLNKHLGVIHGDLHLNNATIGHLYSSKSANNKVAYIIDNNNYIFPNNGYFSCIIDFSRSRINPEMHENINDLSLPDGFNIVGDYDKFETSEIESVLNLYIQLFPDKLKKKDILYILFKSRFNAVFKLLTCIDLYMFMFRLNTMLNSKKIPVNKKCMMLLNDIIQMSEKYITSDMNKLLNDESYETKILNTEFPIEQIIKKCFPDFIKQSSKTDIITDCYVLNNTFKKSISKYELFPDVLKVSKYIDKNGKEHNIDQINKIRKSKREDYEKNKLINLEQLKFMARKYLISDLV